VDQPEGRGRQSLILLVGPPNVGKSVIFNNLSGMAVEMANYPGTTVDYTEGKAVLGTIRARIIDTPGTYTLTGSNDAEEVAGAMLEGNPDLVVQILDACNLESSIYLALQVLEHRLPTILVINRMDLLCEKGGAIDIGALSRELGLPVLTTTALSGEGLERLRSTIIEVLSGKLDAEPKRKVPAEWEAAERIREAVTGAPEKRPPTRREIIGDAIMRPWPGVAVAFVVLLGVLAIIVGMGMGLRRFILQPIVLGYIIPWIDTQVAGIVAPGLLQNILIGEYGFLNKGIEWPFTLILPYILSFYLALSILEDSGYMPRLGVMLDGLLGKIGLTGPSIIPILLGYGCGIPAIISTRALPSRKNQMMIALMVSLSVPCVAQTGAFISLLAVRSVPALIFVAFLSVAALIITGAVLNRLLPGRPTPMVMEIPDLLLPKASVLAKKLWMRIKHYLVDGVLPVIGGVAVAAILYETGLMARLGTVMSPLVRGWLHLPEEAAVPLLLGVFRKELTVLPLLEMDLTTLQLVVGSVVALFYVPCVAMLAILYRYFGMRFTLAALILTTGAAFLIGGLIAQIGAVIL